MCFANDVASRFENSQDERLLELAHTRFANFSIMFRADKINKARRAVLRAATRAEFPDSFHAESNWISRSGPVYITVCNPRREREGEERE